MELEESKFPLTHTFYKDYVSERLGAEIVENEFGFIVFKSEPDQLFIVEFFIDEKFRKSGNGKHLLNDLCIIAKAKDKKRITATIYLFDKHASKTLISALLCGFTVNQATNGCILITKEIGA